MGDRASISKTGKRESTVKEKSHQGRLPGETAGNQRQLPCTLTDSESGEVGVGEVSESLRKAVSLWPHSILPAARCSQKALPN